MVFIRHISILLLDLFKNTVLFLFVGFISCGNGTKVVSQTPLVDSLASAKNDTTSAKRNQIHPNTLSNQILIGANQTDLYLPLLKNKKVGIVGNQTTVIFTSDSFTTSKETVSTEVNPYKHLVDSLLTSGIQVKKVFAPEHGFRGKKDAAEHVADGKDVQTGLPIISLYGKNKKPTAKALEGIDIVVFDIQDVGVRFYTYISTLHYVMQACAESKVPLLVLDRPNPNIHYIDGPTLEPEHQSFIGMHPIPSVHGMTIGEYAQMINGEGWLGDQLTCELTIIPVKNYTRLSTYSLPIRPSPNLPNDQSINLYPSLGFFEGTTINAGRGTEMQFQIFGSPDFPLEYYNFSYTPQSNFGAKYPKHKGELCYGKDLRTVEKLNGIQLEWLINAYQNCKNKDKFFNTKSFTSHAGTTKLQTQIEQGYTFREIRKTWLAGIERFKAMRTPYLLYK